MQLVSEDLPIDDMPDFDAGNNGAGMLPLLHGLARDSIYVKAAMTSQGLR